MPSSHGPAESARAQESDALDSQPRTIEQLSREAIVKEGRGVYEMYCAGCHGVDGDGNGPAASFLDPKPRDFRTGVFKFRSTPSGALPTNADLHRTLSQGILRTSMSSWFLLPENQKLAVIEYLKTFSDAWNEDWNYEPAIAIPGTPSFVGEPASVARGAEVYELMKCAECHGAGGQGDGAAAVGMTDDWGHAIQPFDFTSGFLKGGTSPTDIYRTFSTGLDGTPMPAYGDIVDVEDRWHLVSFILSLRGTSSSQSR